MDYVCSLARRHSICELCVKGPATMNLAVGRLGVRAGAHSLIARQQKWSISLSLLACFVFCMPWEDALPLPGAITVCRVVGAVAGAVGLLRIILKGGKSLSPSHYWMVSFLCWQALSALWCIDLDRWGHRCSTMAQLMFMVWLMWQLALTRGQQRSLMSAYVYGCAV